MTVHRVEEYQPCRVPLRRITWCGVSLVTHEGCVASLKRIEARYNALNGPVRYPIRQGDTASYVCRHIAGSSSWSKHSWGCAVDTNWNTNGYGASHHDMPAWFVQLFLDDGWGWGGNWHGTKDWMHTSKFPNEGGDGLLYVGDGQEDDLPYTEEQLKQIIRDVMNEPPTSFKENGFFRSLWRSVARTKDGKPAVIPGYTTVIQDVQK